MSDKKGYRADIDGLRAIAILPVLLFHAHVSGFSGGYVGVDIFFVISGFLITGIIAREVDEGRFSIIRFYERRARRIMPALGVMLVAVLAGAAWLYLPGDFESVPKSALAATLFISNIFFFTETGYFAGGADTKPLLHTWSLAVEEQFYIGFPILLMLVARFIPRHRIAIVGGIAALSLAIAIALQRDTSGFAFYMLPPRAWELFTGALLALGAIPAVRPRWLREGIALAGLAAIGFAVHYYDRDTLFPGITAMLPVVGAAAIIHCAPGTLTGRLLSLRAMTWVGLISYSLYLWHWPLIVLTEYATDAELSGARAVIVILAAFAAAVLSWRFVEQPFRDPRRVSQRRIFLLTGGAMAALCAIALAMIAAGPWPTRFSPQVLALAAGSSDVSPYRAQCHDVDMRGATPCTLGAANMPPDAILWGDSHGVELAYALSEAARTHNRALIQRTTSSCPPVEGYDAPRDPRCARTNTAVLKAIHADRSLRHVFLAAYWANETFNTPAFAAQVDSTIAALVADGRKVTVFGPVPPQDFNVPRELAHFARDNRIETAMGNDAAKVRASTARLLAIFAKWQARGVVLIDPVDTLCVTGRCDIIRDGKPLYFDSHHLSVAGARLLVRSGAPYGR